MNMDKSTEGYRCSSCHSKKVTHGLVKGNLVDGYKGLPLCSKCAKKIDNASPHYWDSESIVDLIDITNPSNNFSWKKVLLSSVSLHDNFKAPRYAMSIHEVLDKGLITHLR